MTAAIEIRDLCVSYRQQPVLTVPALSLPQGCRIAVVGPNGAGKSTLLKAALGLIPRLRGETRFLGQPLDAVRQRIAYVPQRSEVDWDYPITVGETVLLGRYGQLGLFGRLGETDRRLAREAMARLGIDELADRHISALSGGQQQRCFLARALAQQADLHLFDEPFAGVDAKTERAIAGLFETLVREGKTVLCVHHDLNTVADYFDRAVLLNQQLIAEGPVRTALSDEHLARAFDGLVLRRPRHD